MQHFGTIKLARDNRQWRVVQQVFHRLQGRVSREKLSREKLSREKLSREKLSFLNCRAKNCRAKNCRFA
jgi:hypothetical protein